jgi:hypothetical protein
LYLANGQQFFLDCGVHVLPCPVAHCHLVLLYSHISAIKQELEGTEYESRRTGMGAQAACETPWDQTVSR